MDTIGAIMEREKRDTERELSASGNSAASE